jgi:hypothetical protein
MQLAGLALGLKLDDTAVEAISKCDDSVVALLVLDCEQHGLVSKALDKSLWNSHMTHQALYDKHWLLAYEANVKKWLPSSGGTDYVRDDVNFGFLKRNKVSFYDSSLAAPAPPARRKRRKVPLPTLPTVSLIEFAEY